jgi:hypothetical protein
MAVDFGFIAQRKTTMPVKVNANGSFVKDTSNITWQTGVSVNGVPAGNYALYKTTLGKIEVIDGTEPTVIEFVGISDGNVVAPGGTVTYMPPDGVIDPLVSAFGVSAVELWCKDDGTLVDFSAVVAGKFTRRVGVLFEAGSTKLSVVAGEHLLKTP